MEQVEVFKALANESRLKILQWMREPDKHFGDCPTGGARGRRVCVGEIQSKLGLSQSTASQYLAILEQAGLVRARREGQWTFYERNEDAIQAVSQYVKQAL
ncbi:MAG TPA: metalloregulator ArsR/SmtB family transcription factor [Gammaproteobacteria bacterium]|nr:metalloregulator ArsR/SmtB family transcription factor [Gammaproteobacteria bacterium]